MAKKKISCIVEDMLNDFLKENGLELYNTEFLKEGKDWFLRVYIDKVSQDEDAPLYVSTDDCEMVSRFLSQELDKLDPIEQNYYLEVSSPGMDRALLKEQDYARFSGQVVDVSLYKALDGKKTFQGVLLGLQDGKIKIKDEDDNIIEFEKEQVAKTKLAIIF